jgi:N-acetylglucosaminyldiphosphoundecaprenol N-acetyl-beta-D-mannosaminyltransferase
LTTAVKPHSTQRGCTVLGVKCFVGDLEAAAETVLDRARSGAGGYACLGNAHVLVTAQHDEQFKAALADAWVTFPDGAPVAWVQRRRAATGAVRVCGPDLMPFVIERGVPAGVRHFLLGAGEDVLARLRQTLNERFPAVEIVGSYSPSRQEIESDAASIVERIRTAEPAIVWCAFGAPRQELWMSRNARALAPAVLVGVGAAFDFLAGAKARAPVWMQRSGLEWLHRLLHEPRRLTARYVKTNSEFALRALAEVVWGRRP